MEELEKTSQELKNFLSKYDTAIMLGHISDLIWMDGLGMANEEHWREKHSKKYLCL